MEVTSILFMYCLRVLFVYLLNFNIVGLVSIGRERFADLIGLRLGILVKIYQFGKI